MKFTIEQISNGYTVVHETSTDAKNKDISAKFMEFFQSIMAIGRQREEYESDPELWRAQNRPLTEPQPFDMESMTGMMSSAFSDKTTIHFSTYAEVLQFMEACNPDKQPEIKIVH